MAVQGEGGPTAEPSMETIATAGDLVLLVGNPVKAKLLVSSAVLQGASKVFTALLGPHFREGQTTQTELKKIEFPEDDTTGMSDMCHLLHNKPPDGFTANQTPSKRMLSYAVVVDKYDCIDALCLQSRALLLSPLMNQNHTQRDARPLEDGERLLAAYLLKDHAAFESTSAHLIGGTNKPYSEMMESSCSSLIPSSWLYTLSERRIAAQHKVMFDLAYMTACQVEDCRIDARWVEWLRKGFNISCWPPDCSVEGEWTVFRSILAIEKFGAVPSKALCGHAKNNLDDGEEEYLEEFVGELRRRCTGLCLECASRNEMRSVIECKDKSHR